jgi:hypothetical protein
VEQRLSHPHQRLEASRSIQEREMCHVMRLRPYKWVCVNRSPKLLHYGQTGSRIANGNVP